MSFGSCWKRNIYTGKGATVHDRAEIKGKTHPQKSEGGAPKIVFAEYVPGTRRWIITVPREAAIAGGASDLIE